MKILLAMAGLLFSAAPASTSTPGRAAQQPPAAPMIQREDELLLQLRDQDPEARLLAVRSLKSYMSRSARSREALLRVLADRGETLAVRHEAVKTLSAAGGYPEVRAALLGMAKDWPIALKALYGQAISRPEVREYLLDVARSGRDTEMRKAAVWGLFLAAAGDDRVRGELQELAEYASDLSLRAEALKSLYGERRARDLDRE